MTTTDWFATIQSATPPAIIEMGPAEQKNLHFELASLLAVGETASAPVITLRNYRTNLDLGTAALSGSPSYDGTAKRVTQKVLSAFLPFGIPVRMILSYSVSYPGGTEVRSMEKIIFAR